MYLKKAFNIIILLLAISVNTIAAQEISIYTSVYNSGLEHKFSQGKRSKKISGGVGINYTYYLTKKWEIVTGIELSKYRTSYSLKNGKFTSFEVDETGTAFQYLVKTTNYKENQQLTTVNIPLLLQYRSTGDIQFYCNGGVKFFIPVSHHLKATAKSIETKGYYPNYNATIDNVENRGFGTINNWMASTNEKLAITLANIALAGISFETGIGFKLKKDILFTGIFVDYGIGRNKDTKSIISYGANGLKDIKPNGVLKTTKQSPHIFAVGLHLKYSFSLKDKSKITVINF